MDDLQFPNNDGSSHSPNLYSREGESEVAQSCLTLCDPVDCRPPDQAPASVGFPRQDSSREAHAKPLAMSLSRLLDAPATFVGPENSTDKAGEGEASPVPSQSEAVHSFCDSNVHQGFLALL